MIYIDMSNFAPPAAWLQKANEQTASLIAATDMAAKNIIINAKPSHWSKLKANLPFCHKCWFTEAPGPASHFHIEHFRPKKKVKKVKESDIAPFDEEDRTDWATNDGYWWLAFDYQNYRIAGSKINTNKGNYFPLQLSSPIAYSPIDDYSLELPLLLDPTVQGDPDLLTFDSDGKASPAYTGNTDIRHIRAAVSIKIYGLNKIPDLTNARKQKWSDFHKAVTRANHKYGQFCAVVNDSNKTLANFYGYYDEYRDFVDNDIKPALSTGSPYTAVAYAYLLSCGYEWISEEGLLDLLPSSLRPRA